MSEPKVALDSDERREVERLRSEVHRLRVALEHLASPNTSVRATGFDAHEMARFARRVLDEAAG